MPPKLYVCIQQRYAPNPACCANKGSLPLKKLLEEKVKANGLQVEVAASGCMGLCQSGPNLRLEPQGKVWNRATAEMADEVINFMKAQSSQ